MQRRQAAGGSFGSSDDILGKGYTSDSSRVIDGVGLASLKYVEASNLPETSETMMTIEQKSTNVFASFFMAYHSGCTRFAPVSKGDYTAVSEERVVNHMKFLSKFGTHETGTISSEINVSNHITEFLNSLQDNFNKNSWVLQYEQIHSSGGYNTVIHDTISYVLYKNVTNIIVSLNPSSNEGTIDYTVLPSLLINVPVDSDIFAQDTFTSNTLLASILDTLMSLSHTPSAPLYNTRLLFNFCFASTNQEQCYQTFSTHKWSTSTFAAINLEVNRDLGDGFILFKEMESHGVFSSIYKHVPYPRGNSFSQYILSLLHLNEYPHLSKYNHMEDRKDIPFVNMYMGLSSFSSSVPPEGYIQPIVEDLYTFITLAAQKTQQDFHENSAPNTFFITLFNTFFFSFNYTYLLLFSCLSLVLFYILYPLLGLKSLSTHVISSIVLITVFLTVSILFLILSVFVNLTYIWHYSLLYGYFSFGGLCTVVYIYIYNIQYKQKLKKYIALTTNYHILILNFFSILLLLLFSLLHSPFAIYPLITFITSSITFFMPKLFAILNIYIKNLPRGEPFFLSLFINTIPLSIIFGFILRDFSCFYLPFSVILGSVSPTTVEIAIVVFILVQIFFLLLSLHPYIYRFTSYSEYYVTISFSILVVLLLSFYSLITSSSYVSMIHLLHTTNLKTIELREHNRYNAAPRGNYIEIYTKDTKNLYSITKSFKLPQVPRSSLSLAYTYFGESHYSGLHAQIDKANTIPLFNNNHYPFIYLKREEVCNKKCSFKPLNTLWKRRLQFVLDLSQTGGLSYMEIIYWDISKEIPSFSEVAVSPQNNKQKIYKYKILFNGGLSSNVLSFKLLFAVNSDVTINLYTYYSPQSLTERNQKQTNELLYISKQFGENIYSNNIYTIESHFVFPKYVKENQYFGFYN
ncbi:hypothetical protein WA158_008453 [Blastocystis sp. Blastoise]